MSFLFQCPQTRLAGLGARRERPALVGCGPGDRGPYNPQGSLPRATLWQAEENPGQCPGLTMEKHVPAAGSSAWRGSHELWVLGSQPFSASPQGLLTHPRSRGHPLLGTIVPALQAHGMEVPGPHPRSGPPRGYSWTSWQRTQPQAGNALSRRLSQCRGSQEAVWEALLSSQASPPGPCRLALPLLAPPLLAGKEWEIPQGPRAAQHAAQVGTLPGPCLVLT